jgi:surface antigen
MRRRLLFSLICLAGLLAGASGARAQAFVTPTGPQISSQDWPFVNKAVTALLGTEPLVNGSQQSWSNPRTRNSGTVTARGEVVRNGHTCQKVEYHFVIHGQSDPGTYYLNLCRMPDGTWKIAS